MGARAVLLVACCTSYAFPTRAATEEPSWHVPESWLRVHAAITPVYLGSVTGDDGYGATTSGSVLVGAGAQYLFRVDRNVALGGGVRYFAIQAGEFGHELMVPLLLSIIVPWSQRLDSDLTLGVGYAGAWVPPPFGGDRMLTNGVSVEAGIGASYELGAGFALSFRATAFVASTGAAQANSLGYSPSFGFLQAGVPFELGVRQRW